MLEDTTNSPSRLQLPSVTLCAATSVNVTATLRALIASIRHIKFADCKIFTDKITIDAPSEISVVRIPKINSSAAYSRFILREIVDHIDTSHCLVAQWDGHVIQPRRWDETFLDYDFVGARWPQFADGHAVGNGGFSLRSKALMEACRDSRFQCLHPEDLAIGRFNRAWLEGQGFRFAPPEVADRFSTERAGDLRSSFGYHGVWNMPEAIGIDNFWDVYRSLDELSTIRTDFKYLLFRTVTSPGGIPRAIRMLVDYASHKLRVAG